MLSANGNSRSSPFLDLSAKVEYALLALMELANDWHRKTPLTINEITARQPIPDRYLEHIFTILRRGGLVQSQRGAKGGYVLTREPWKITVLDVVMLIEGDRKERDDNGFRSVERDLVREIWQEASTASQTTLGQYTLQDLNQKREAEIQTNPMYYI